MLKHSGRNHLSRPYDDVIPVRLLAQIQERRRSPDGVQHQVQELRRGSDRVYHYPWPKMELGDFFIAPIGTRSPKAMRIACHQAAARYDFEIAIAEVEVGIQKALRVTVTILNLSQWKIKAEAAGIKGIRHSDGKWLERRKKWYAETTPPTKLKITAKNAHLLDNPFHADHDPELPPPDTTMTPAPEVKLSREEVIQRVLAQSK